MRICFISLKAYQLFNPEIKSTFGGAEAQLYLLAIELAKDTNLDIHFMTADYGQKKLEIYHRVKVWRSLNFKHNITRQILNFYRVLRKINADAYIQRTLSPFSCFITLYCRLRKKKFIYMVSHDSEVDNSHTIYNHFLSKKSADLTFKLANMIIVQNNYQANKLKKLKKCQSELIHSSYPIENFPKQAGEYILWIGRSMPWKQPEIFIDLAKNFTNEKFVMICPPATDNPRLSDKIAEKATKINNLRFIKFVSFNQIDNYFKRAKIFVNTSKQEGFPNTFVQAAKNKVPILSLAINPNEFIINNRCGFICDNNIDTLRERLQQLLIDDNLRREMAKNAYAYAQKNHDIKINAKIFLKSIHAKKLTS